MLQENPAAIAAGIGYTALLLAIARGDLATRRIPNRLVLVLAAAGFVAAATVLREPVGAAASLGGIAVGFGIWLPFWLGRVLGAGDVKLAAAIGAWVGIEGMVAASILAALAGGVLALGVLVRERRIGALGADMLYWFGTLRIGGMRSAAMARPTPTTHGRAVLPYGVALAAGGLLAGWLPAAQLAWLRW